VVSQGLNDRGLGSVLFGLLAISFVAGGWFNETFEISWDIPQVLP
jgi:hypothetical protein